MKVTYELTPEDVWHYQGYYRRYKAALRPTYVYLLLGMCGFVCVGGGFVAWEAWARYQTVQWNVLLPLAVLVFIIPRVLPPSKARITKLHRQKLGTFSQHSYQISQEWFSQTTPVNQSKDAWVLFLSLEEDKDYLYYFKTKATAYIIPKRAFTSYSDAQAFLDASRRYWEAAKNGVSSAAEPEGVWPPAPRPGA